MDFKYKYKNVKLTILDLLKNGIPFTISKTTISTWNSKNTKIIAVYYRKDNSLHTGKAIPEKTLKKYIITPGEKIRREGISKNNTGNKNARQGKENKNKTFAGIRVDQEKLEILIKNYELSGANCQSSFLIDLGLKADVIF